MGCLPPEPGRGTWTAASPATTCPTLPQTRLWRLWHTWAVPGGALKRSSRRRRATWGWTNTRPGVGRVGSTIALCLLGGAFLLGLQQDWGKKMPQITRPQVYRVVREMLPRERFGPEELLRWLNESQRRNEQASRSHARRRSARRQGRMEPPP